MTSREPIDSTSSVSPMKRVDTTTIAPPFPIAPDEAGAGPIRLVPERDVVLLDGGGIATSREPWLRLEMARGVPANRWVELIYEASLVDPLARPLLRCLTTHDVKEEILPGPLFGRGVWLGKIPAKTKAIWISPTDRPGPFAFRVVGLREISFSERVVRGWRPRYTLLAIGYSLAGRLVLAELHFRRTLMSTPLGSYRSWRESRRREPDWGGLDALPAAAAQGPHIRVVLPESDSAAVARWLSRLRTQPWPHWSLAARADGSVAPQEGVIALESGASLLDCLADLEPRDLVVLARPDEEWAPEALAIAGAAALRDDSDLFYADEESAGQGATPHLKPDWSPILAQSIDLIGRAWFARVGWARAAIGELATAHLVGMQMRVSAGARVTHISRILLTVAGAPAAARRRAAAPPPARRGHPCASIVIPIRDRVDLLRPCLESLMHPGRESDFEVIIVDNDSRRPATRAYLAEIMLDARFRLLERPGSFNFSALCNDAAAEARAETLVFLNNDTLALSSDWLERLIAWTPLPSVGAVGAKLVFPDGTIQHAGVIMGVDGHANHFERSIAPDQTGYFQRIDVPHEISAVTGACLAVAKAKFDAIGGFDAQNLPVEFSDVDLCLRLTERGWTSMLDPSAVLIHHQAATRKASRNQECRYAREAAYFKARWRHRLRADPYFHPALSLDWHWAALA
jgi:GT2 family glycosyltransferase